MIITYIFGNLKMYSIYILHCSDNSLYTGITNNLEKRLKMHNGDLPGGAKYTRGRLPITLVYTETLADRSQATKRELQIKKLSKKEKLKLIAKQESSPVPQ